MKYQLFVTALLMSGLTSCSIYRYIYSAAPANNPYFKEKGESKLTAYYSSANQNRLTKEYANGLDVQGAYAFGDRWALTAGYMNRKEKDVYGESLNIFDTSVVRYKRHLFEIGGGYFIALNTRKSVTGNLYAGFATGQFSFKDNGEDKNNLIYNRFHESAVNKWFFQPSLNFMPGNYVRFSFATKISFVHYGKIQTSYTLDEIEYFSLQNITNKTLSFFEPSLDIQFGIPQYPWVKIDAVISVPLIIVLTMAG